MVVRLLLALLLWVVGLLGTASASPHLWTLTENRVWGIELLDQSLFGTPELLSLESHRGNAPPCYDSTSDAPVSPTKAAGAADEVTVYRAFGGDARAQGYSWTTTDPRTVGNFRDAAGLPSGGASGATNTADFLIQGRARTSDIIKSRSALPLDGNKGGLPELIIDPKNVTIDDFSVLNP